MMQYNIWLMPYGNFCGDDHNSTWGVAVKIAEKLKSFSTADKTYNCRIKRVGVNIYDADDAFDEVEFLEKSGQLNIHAVIALGTGGPDQLFNFEHTGIANGNTISDSYDLYGRAISTPLREYADNLSDTVAGWYFDDSIRHLVQKIESAGGQRSESTGAGDYLCAYMTEKLAASSVLSNKSFFIHIKDFDSAKDESGRNRAGQLIAGFVDRFCQKQY
ncbi:hypothetical protein [Thiothrix subterranea]|uniref:Nucleoside phosphorylase domain-containing protein n=1 Tax=Thiothrix subterranea TaxID=2735563 RepID=A0ABU0Y3F4_9GAMM|nr:hypothetical protein [Thiothrix subterranea]MDQ5766899.1 hypothetical protein [Thiothrix subterranea]